MRTAFIFIATIGLALASKNTSPEMMTGAPSNVPEEEKVKTVQSVLDVLNRKEVTAGLKATAENIGECTTQVVNGIKTKFEYFVGNKVCHFTVLQVLHEGEEGRLLEPEEVVHDCPELFTASFKEQFQAPKKNKKVGAPSECEDPYKSATEIFEELASKKVLKNFRLREKDIVSCEFQVVRGLATYLTFIINGAHCSVSVVKFNGNTDLMFPAEEIAICPQIFDNEFRNNHEKYKLAFAGFNSIPTKNRVEEVNSLLKAYAARHILVPLTVKADDIMMAKSADANDQVDYQVALFLNGRVCHVHASLPKAGAKGQWDKDANFAACFDLIQHEKGVHFMSEEPEEGEGPETLEGGRSKCDDPETTINSIIQDLSAQKLFAEHTVKIEEIRDCQVQIMDGIYVDFEIVVDGKPCVVKVAQLTETSLAHGYHPKENI